VDGPACAAILLPDRPELLRYPCYEFLWQNRNSLYWRKFRCEQLGFAPAGPGCVTRPTKEAAMTAQMDKIAYDSGQAIPYVDRRIYTDHGIFEEELEKIWKKVWLATVHESELAEPLDFRTMTVAREPIVIVRGSDNKIRAFLNVCPHRGNLILR